MAKIEPAITLESVEKRIGKERAVRVFYHIAFVAGCGNVNLNSSLDLNGCDTKTKQAVSDIFEKESPKQKAGGVDKKTKN